MKFFHPKTLTSTAQRFCVVLLTISASISLLVAIYHGWWYLQPGNKVETAAASSLHKLGANFVKEIQRVVAPAMQRTQKLGKNPEIVKALQTGDRELMTQLCNQAICNSTEIDAVALFDSNGSIAAINTRYADNKPIHQDRVDRILAMKFQNRPIISRCISNNASDEVLEFQTQCDITPSFFGSTGLAVAHSVPIYASASNSKLGVVSTRLRFERISSLIENNSTQNQSFYFVTDEGGYFNEEINAGTSPAPIPTEELKKIVVPLTQGHSEYAYFEHKEQHLGIFRLNSFHTIDGGGIQVLVIANRDWIDRETFLATATSVGFPFCISILLYLSAGIAWNGVTLSVQRNQLRDAVNSNRRLATIIEGSEDAIIVELLDGTVGYWNPGAERLFGYKVEEILHKPIDVLVPESCSLAKKDLVKQLMNGLPISQFETTRVAKDGTELAVSITASILRDENGQILGLSKIIRDIRSHKIAEAELDLARRAAEAANQSKSEFLANMSHEIRTPMTAILGFADVLDTDGDFCVNPAFARGAIQTIRSNANHLLTIINDILDMSKIDAGKLTIERLPMSPVSLLDEIVLLMQPNASGKGISLQLTYDSLIPSTIESDPTRLRQILLNLVGNAIKFTEVGGITIQTTYLAESHCMKFCVKDTGLGMSAEQRDCISKFDAFSQADTSTTRRFGGTGLGLRISNSLATMLGGNIQVESELGVGSTFTVTIATGDLTGTKMVKPLKVPENAAPTSQASTKQQTDLNGLRILLAEDGPDNQRLISFHLKKAGADVTIAENGLIAAELIEADPELFDLVLMDMQMPVLDGYGATKRLRHGGFEIPILAVTAHAMDGDRQKCLDAGCDDFITKPIQRDLLLELASRYSKKPKSQESLVQTIIVKN